MRASRKLTVMLKAAHLDLLLAATSLYVTNVRRIEPSRGGGFALR